MFIFPFPLTFPTNGSYYYYISFIPDDNNYLSITSLIKVTVEWNMIGTYPNCTCQQFVKKSRQVTKPPYILNLY